MTLEDLWRENFPKRIKYIMQAKNISQKELVKITHISQATASRYISGTSIPNVLVVIKIAKALDIPIALLVHDYPISKISSYIEKQEKGKKNV